MPDLRTVTVKVYVPGVGEASASVAVAAMDYLHVCGASGFGIGSGDRCYRCDAEREAARLAHAQLDALINSSKEQLTHGNQ
jgi:hypothetical protein